MESPWCHRCTLLLFEGKHVEVCVADTALLAVHRPLTYHSVTSVRHHHVRVAPNMRSRRESVSFASRQLPRSRPKLSTTR